jgi:hypothetical protein
LLRSAIERAELEGRPCVFATVPAENTPALRLFERAGFCRTGALANHYRRAGAEVVVVRPTSDSPLPELSEEPRVEQAESSVERMRRYVATRFFPVDAAWERWLAHEAGPSLGEFEHKPHDLVEDDRGGVALVIYKRGGTAKVVPIIAGDAAPSPTLVRACEQAAHLRGRRKISVFLPHGVAALPGYDRELVAAGYSIRTRIAVWSRHLDT